jgi:hypothetical protein
LPSINIMPLFLVLGDTILSFVKLVELKFGFIKNIRRFMFDRKMALLKVSAPSIGEHMQNTKTDLKTFNSASLPPSTDCYAVISLSASIIYLIRNYPHPT